ncbi:alpha/beta fold hydrolase [Lentibacter sp. XHP0401]|jgi:pimeloyl-ACP methyl ester carboxylesterase|uniref:alpha/beta fold hydrolase n=1 Tax=Lentibacter sp. XHP0401 TaxID=2984334 RepID=UPI0021E7A8B5|nr:alpha/beta hydrolase [Lentibacter sp. XHP0401]MCV2893270.1 alpha/beta hydrolase [Lentibacter sp. XHP0401]
MREPLLFIPGMMCDARLFWPQVEHFSRSRNVMVACTAEGERIEEIASSILLESPQKFALAGLSMGGIVAMEILRRAPERVTRLCLMDTNPLAETPQSAAAYEPMIVGVKSGRMIDVLRGFLKPEFLAPGPQRIQVLSQVQAMAESLGPEVFLRQIKALQRRRDQQAALRKAKMPALVMCGEYDGLTPRKRHEFMAELIPYAKLAIVEGAGHLPTLEAPEQVNALLTDWLKQPYVLRS